VRSARPDASGERHDAKADLAFTVALFLVALAPRIFVGLAWAREPVWDGHYYHFGATRIAEGLGYSEDVIVDGIARWKPWCHYPVGYSGFLAMGYALFGSDLAVAPLMNAFTGALLAAVTHQLALRYTTLGRARVAGVLAALHPGLIVYSATLMTEPLAALGVMAAALVVATRARPATAALGGGLLVGLATLVRPPSLLSGPLLAFCWRGRRGSALLIGALTTTVAIATVLPWTMRNCRVMDGCALVSTNGGWNLAIGALTDTGRFRTLHASDGCPVVTGQVQQDRCWARVGIETIRRAPGRWLALVPRKLAQTFDHESFAIEYLHEADPADWPEPRRVAGRQLLSGAHRLLLVVAALGMLAWPGRRLGRIARVAQGAGVIGVLGVAGYATQSDEHPFYLLVLALLVLAALPLPGAPRKGPVGTYLVTLIAASALTHAVFFGDDRYHLVITPALCVLAAGALGRTSPRPAEAPKAARARDNPVPPPVDAWVRRADRARCP
jgi:4-amino-4-deoxy-L-arabinose transferase-like glycosyltransferase